ncbi:MAG TPA: GGDEF domain-containing protein [Solirubrobacterales bacterium]|nr:GGDEF domain-containing protein [Solirubrobacterales bacterium]
MRTEAAAEYARIEMAQDDLAKAWLVRIIERTPPSELGDLPVSWIANEAPPLIAEILRELASGAAPDDLAPERRRRARELGKMRRGAGGPAQIPEDLASLQTLLIEALQREVPERQSGSFAESVGRLAEIFGSIQSGVAEALVDERSGWAKRDDATGLPGSAQLHEWLRILVAEYRRYAHPFALLLVDIDGLGRINEAYGRQVGDRMIGAVASAIDHQVRTVDRAFRLAEDEFCILAPHQVASRVQPLADRLTSTVNGWQHQEGPRMTVTVGVASCPEHGDNEQRLLEAAEEATYAAKASGRRFAVGSGGAKSFVQEPDST